MSINRRRLLSIAASAGTIPVGFLAAPWVARAQAAEFSFRFGNNLPGSHPMNVQANQMVELIKAETNGRVEIRVFPASQLGNDTEMLAMLRSGKLDFLTMSGLILSSQVPVASINGIGFAFPDYATVWRAMDGPLGSYIRSEIAKSGLIAMEKIWDSGYRQTTSSTKLIEGPEDFKGMKLRVPVSPLWTSMFKALGAVPTAMNFADVYAALKARTVDGQENPLAIIATAKLNEVQRYCTLTNHMWDGFWFLANGSSWMTLPNELRILVAKHINEAALRERRDVSALNAGLENSLAARGMAFAQVKPEPFREALRKAGFYAEWRAQFGDQPWSLLEQATGKLS